jgi:hypothetical protein
VLLLADFPGSKTALGDIKALARKCQKPLDEGSISVVEELGVKRVRFLIA